MAGYEVQWTPRGQDWHPARRAVVVGLSYTVAGLDAATAYSVRVRPAAVETAAVAGASIVVGAGAVPVAELVSDPPPLRSSALQSVSTLPGVVDFQLTGETVWPATITIPLDMERVGDSGDVQLVYFDESLGVWVPVPDAVVDRDRGVITAEVYHLTWFSPVCLIFVLTCAVAAVVDAFEEIVGFVDAAWNATTGWLSAGWETARDFLLEDLPLLAQAVLDKMRETGQYAELWVQVMLELAKSVSPEMLANFALPFNDLVAMITADLSGGASSPQCPGARPDWVSDVSYTLSSKNALLKCDETAGAAGDGEADLGLALTVNRGYPLIMRSQTSGVRFGDRSPERVSVDETEFPEHLADFAASKLYAWGSRGRSVFLPAGTTTRVRVPSAAIRAAGRAAFVFEADQIALLLHTLLLGINTFALVSGTTPAQLTSNISSVLECAWGTFERTADADESALRSQWRDVVGDCGNPVLDEVLENSGGAAVASNVMIAISGFLLLYKYAEIAADGFLNPNSHRLAITAHPPTTAPQQPPPTTAPQQPPPTDTIDRPQAPILTVGATAQGRPGCSSVHCRHLTITLPDWTAGEYDIECWSSRDPEPWHTGTWHWPTFTLWTEGGCWFGYPGAQVWAVVDGVRSNTVTWPAGTNPAATTLPSTAEVRPELSSGINTSMDGGGIVSVGQSVACGVSAEHTVVCWGNVREEGLDPPPGTFTAVSTSVESACGIRTDQTLTCWGRDHFGIVADVPSGTFMSVSVGGSHACAMRTDETVTCWGANWGGETDPPPGSFSVVSSRSHRPCGLTTDRTITCWGGAGGPALPPAPEGSFTAVSSGMGHSCALKIDGTAICWGSGGYGLTESDFPVGTYTSVTAGNAYSCAIRTDQTITCWAGYGAGYDLSPAPAGTFLAVSAGFADTICGVRVDRTITCWGPNPLDAPVGQFGPQLTDAQG